MKRRSFNGGWYAGPKVGAFDNIGGAPTAEAVTLPHDILRDLPRSAGSDQGVHTGYHPGGHFEYTKSFDVPEHWQDKTVLLDFEGIYRDAVVYVNGAYAGQRPNGYTGLTVDLVPYLRFGATNTVAVQARAHKDSRWYTGSGIYRNVHLVEANATHIALDGVRVTTPDIEPGRAITEIATTVENNRRVTRTLRVTTRVVGPDGTTVAEGSAPITVLPHQSAVTRIRLAVPTPALWSPDSPHLHEVHTTLSDGDELIDEERTTFGIRTLQVDPDQGLRINGERINLRGACVHHDNGLLGAATITRAEERRIEILKMAGFNAIRSAHNPLSRSMLEACDRIGMLVMDELTDVWTEAKSAFDYSLSFPEWWERDLEAMVAKDFNHPSVIMYSLGNEIFETGSPFGGVWSRRLAEKTRELDPTRFVTNGLNALLATKDRLVEILGEEAVAGATDVNTMIATMGDLMAQVGASDLASELLEESASVLDVVGFNYADSRYEADAKLVPHRVIVGSETFPAHIDELWRLVRENSHVIGDFTWTGWDYIGESGIGRIDYTDEPEYMATGVAGRYPYYLAMTGDIDITGHRRPISYYRETVFGRRQEPYIAVHRPQFHGRPTSQSPWAWTDSISSWSWDVSAGSPVTVDVYSDAEEVELLLDGKSLGTAVVGKTKAFIARFETQYIPGTLLAVARSGGADRGSTTLRSAGDDLELSILADRTIVRSDDTDLAYVEIRLQDRAGNLAGDHDRVITVNIEGAGILAGLGSADPCTEGGYGGTECTTYDGRALAVVRPTSSGDIVVTVASQDLTSKTVIIRAGQAS